MTTEEPSTMRAATINRYGSPDVIEIKNIEHPRCGSDEVVISVRAASLNPYDWHMMSGTPLITRLGGGLFSPKSSRLGIDVSGVIVEVGRNVTQFKQGDAVFGTATGSFAEYVTCTPATLAIKPSDVSFEEAAATPVASLTALQGLVNKGHLEKGQRVLINGASGGVGTYAVQIAKHLGAFVTGVCSSRNTDLVSSLGADRVVDYSSEDFTTDIDTYDLILDNIGNRALSAYKRCLTPKGIYVVVSGPKRPVLGPLVHFTKTILSFMLSSQRASAFIAQPNSKDMETLADLLRSGAMRSVIDCVLPLGQIAEGLSQIETQRTRGKIVVTP